MEYGQPLTVTPTRGDAVAFNTPDADGNVYVLQEVQGFDSATMRTLVQDAAQKPGALVFPAEKGAQYPGLRGAIVASDPSTAFTMEQNLRRLNDAMMKEWALMEWTNSDGIQRRMRVAAQNISIQGSIPKEFLLQMVSDQAQKDGGEVHTLVLAEGDTAAAYNNGDMNAYMVGTLWGPFSTASLRNEETGIALELQGTVAVADGDFIAISMYDETLYRNGDYADYIGSYLTENADFFPLLPGSQDLSFVTDDGGSISLQWYDGWA